MAVVEATTPKKSRAGPAGQPPVVAVASAFSSPSHPVEMLSPRRKQYVSKNGDRKLNNEGQVATSDQNKKEKDEAHARTRKEDGIIKEELDLDSTFRDVCDDSDSVEAVQEKLYDSRASQFSCSSCEEEEEMEREESVKIDGRERNNSTMVSPLRRAAEMLSKKKYKRQNKVSPLVSRNQIRVDYSKIEEDEEHSTEESSNEKCLAPRRIKKGPYNRISRSQMRIDNSKRKEDEESGNDKRFIPCNTKRGSYNQRRIRVTKRRQCPENTYVNDGLSSDEDNERYLFSLSNAKTTASLLDRLSEMEEEIYALQKDNQALRAKERNKKMILTAPLQIHSELFAEKSSAIELSVPQILCNGGYLCKIPFHRSGTQKRRWVQVLPAGGLKTDAYSHFIPSGFHSNGRAAPSTLSLLHRDHRRSSTRRGEELGGGEFVTMMAASPVTLIWFDPKYPIHSSPPREMEIRDIEAVLGGHKTMAFWQQAVHRGSGSLPAQSLCFSLIGKERTLDLHTETPEKARQWREALMFLVSEHQLQNEGNELEHKRRQSWDMNFKNKDEEEQFISGFHSARNARAPYSPIHKNDVYPKMN